MNVDFTDEQTMLKEGIARRFSPRADLRAQPQADRWQEYAEAGFLGMPLPEALGGLGGGAIELAILMEEAGRARIRDPFVTSLVMPAALLYSSAAQPECAGWIAALVDGSHRYAAALDETTQCHDPDAVATVAVPREAGWVLSGRKSLIPYLDHANWLIVSARSGGTAGPLALFLIDAAADGIVPARREGWDGRSVFDVRFDAVAVPAGRLLLEGDAAAQALDRAHDLATAALCAEAVGAMAGALDLTVGYAKTRRQFGQPLAAFQVLRHRIVDMLMDVELSRSAALAAASACQNGTADERRRAVSLAKLQINRAGRRVGQAAVQLHGAIGMTEEYQLGEFFTRLTVIAQRCGGDDFHLARLTADAAEVAGTPPLSS
jgi:alkylation response protein AidB-like acyl-CoA dehydrogenase